MPISHRDFLCTPTETVDIGFIWDKANVEAPGRRPKVDVHPLGENLADTVEQAQGYDHATSKPTNTNSVDFAPCTSRAPSPLGLRPHQ